MMSFSDRIEELFPVNEHKTNPGSTHLVPSSKMTSKLKKFTSEDPVTSTTLHQLVKFANSNQIILKIDVEVSMDKME